MIKTKYKINLPLILSLCLLDITLFVHHPETGVFSILYDIMILAILLAIMLLFYAQIKSDIKK